jgi:predicted small metal-binding protein
MKYTFACKDIGLDCGFKTDAKTKEELMPKIAAHAKEKHGMDTIPPDEESPGRHKGKERPIINFPFIFFLLFILIIN